MKNLKRDLCNNVTNYCLPLDQLIASLLSRAKGQALFRFRGPRKHRKVGRSEPGRKGNKKKRKKEGEGKEVDRPQRLLTLAGEGPLTRGGGARFLGLARGSSS